MNREAVSAANGSPPPCRETVRLADLKAPSPEDGHELIRNRFVCRGGSLLFVGPTGSGKSSFVVQAGIQWSVGKPCFGLHPVGPLRVLYVQAENDGADLYEMRQGIFEGLDQSEQDMKDAGDNFRIATVNDSVSTAFVVNVLRPLLAATKPDLVILDPLLAFLGGDVTRQDFVSIFIRSGLQPAIAAANCGLLLVHHPPKPRDDIRKPNAGDDAYFGAGSADLANWARAVMVLKPTRNHGVYKLKLAKRGRRAGWVEEDGQTPSFECTIAHGTGGRIYWRRADPGEVFTPVTPDTAKSDLLALVPPDGPVDKDLLISRAKIKEIGMNRARGVISELVAEGKLFEWRLPRPRTCPKIALARTAQPQTEKDQ